MRTKHGSPFACELLKAVTSQPGMVLDQARVGSMAPGQVAAVEVRAVLGVELAAEVVLAAAAVVAQVAALVAGAAAERVAVVAVREAVVRAPRTSRLRDSLLRSRRRLRISSTRSISASTAACLARRSSDDQTAPARPVSSSSAFD